MFERSAVIGFARARVAEERVVWVPHQLDFTSRLNIDWQNEHIKNYVRIKEHVPNHFIRWLKRGSSIPNLALMNCIDFIYWSLYGGGVIEKSEIRRRYRRQFRGQRDFYYGLNLQNLRPFSEGRPGDIYIISDNRTIIHTVLDIGRGEVVSLHNERAVNGMKEKKYYFATIMKIDDFRWLCENGYSKPLTIHSINPY